MRVFVTGAAGFIGQAVVKELVGAGHKVVGLARSDKNAEILTALGADVLRGSLEDLASLKQGAAASDGVIHLAFIHDFSNHKAACEADQLALEAMGEALAGSNRPLVFTAGTLMLPLGRLVTEQDAVDMTGFGAYRGASEALAKSLLSRGVRTAVIRLAPTVHGEGDHGFVPTLIAAARKNAMSVYVGDGLNRWPAVHRLDAAKLFRLALEKGTPGAAYHGVAEEGIATKEIAQVIANRLHVPAVSKSQEEANELVGFLGMVLSRDNPTSSDKTKQELGWTPVHPTLLADLNNSTYFEQ